MSDVSELVGDQLYASYIEDAWYRCVLKSAPDFHGMPCDNVGKLYFFVIKCLVILLSVALTCVSGCV